MERQESKRQINIEPRLSIYFHKSRFRINREALSLLKITPETMESHGVKVWYEPPQRIYIQKRALDKGGIQLRIGKSESGVFMDEELLRELLFKLRVAKNGKSGISFQVKKIRYRKKGDLPTIKCWGPIYSNYSSSGSEEDGERKTDSNQMGEA